MMTGRPFLGKPLSQIWPERTDQIYSLINWVRIQNALEVSLLGQNHWISGKMPKFAASGLKIRTRNK